MSEFALRTLVAFLAIAFVAWLVNLIVGPAIAAVVLGVLVVSFVAWWVSPARRT